MTSIVISDAVGRMIGILKNIFKHIAVYSLVDCCDDVVLLILGLVFCHKVKQFTHRRKWIDNSNKSKYRKEMLLSNHNSDTIILELLTLFNRCPFLCQI